MKVILIKDVPNVGRKYEIKNVADGFALNMLIPRKLAQLATPAAVQRIEVMKAKDTDSKRVQMELLSKNLDKIKELVLRIKEKANDKGHLFAGVTKEILAEEILKSIHLNIDPEWIELAKPLKEVGEHVVRLEVEGKKAEFKVVVESI